MKKIVLLSLFGICLSCNDSQEKEIFKEFKAKQIKEKFSTTPDELNFEILSIEKTKDIIAKDSIKIIRDSLHEYIKSADKVKDTLTFEYAIKEYENLINITQEIILLRIRSGREYENYEDEEQRNTFIKNKVNLEALKSLNDEYLKNINEVLSTEYKAKYSIQNPVLKVKQTFDSKIYSDRKKSKIILEVAE
ncbi:hypothetical protein MG290_03215 [Flavobacterium sp. CBA20B-1]|uniref:hypothetical protein n=1 Tax=unclassified Flavobacterium TaxID=196869 RepID=UPI0022249641|nr:MULTISPECIES: hypothetical protein [unclassified Flavobacterium]WCM42703.1 hypothetical protein MG290_03215 [Flavobacterium sp. CBA20B-1]